MSRQRISRPKAEIVAEVTEWGWVTEDVVKVPCLRCGGSGYIDYLKHVEDGICFKCLGAGEEKHSLDAYVKSIQAQERRDFHAAKEWKAECEARDEQVRAILGNPDPRIVTLVEMLGFPWSEIVDYDFPQIKIPESPYKFEWNLIAQWSSKGTLSDKQWTFVENSIERIKNPPPASQHQGQIKDRLTLEVSIQAVSRFQVDDPYGYGEITKTIVRFVDAYHNVYVWWTTSYPLVEKDEKYILAGTVKKHDEYKGEKQTVLTRCKLKEVE